MYNDGLFGTETFLTYMQVVGVFFLMVNDNTTVELRNPQEREQFIIISFVE
jgi:hypothetical protein